MPARIVDQQARLPSPQAARRDSRVRGVMEQKHMQELMALSPEITGSAVHAMTHEGKLELFHSRARRKGLRVASASCKVNLDTLMDSVDTLLHALRQAAANPAVVAHRCHNVAEAVVVCQRFVRRALARRQRLKSLVFLRWDGQQTKARRVLEAVVKDTIRRRPNAGPGFQEAVWGLLLDCYASPEEMQSTIDEYFRCVGRSYRDALRQFRKEELHAVLRAAKELSQSSAPPSSPGANAVPTTKRAVRRAMAKATSGYAPLCAWSAASASLAELCGCLEYLRAREMHSRLTSALGGGGGVASAAPAPTAPRATQSGLILGRQPVSYYHALLTMNPRTEFPMLLALRLVTAASSRATQEETDGTGHGTGKLWAPPTKDMAQARRMVVQWRVQLGLDEPGGRQGTATAVTTSSPPAPPLGTVQGAFPRSTVVVASPTTPSRSAGHAIAESGSPLARVDCGSHFPPVARGRRRSSAARSSPPFTPSARAGAGATTAGSPADAADPFLGLAPLRSPRRSLSHGPPSAGATRAKRNSLTSTQAAAERGRVAGTLLLSGLPSKRRSRTGGDELGLSPPLPQLK